MFTKRTHFNKRGSCPRWDSNKKAHEQHYIWTSEQRYTCGEGAVHGSCIVQICALDAAAAAVVMPVHRVMPRPQ